MHDSFECCISQHTALKLLSSPQHRTHTTSFTGTTVPTLTHHHPLQGPLYSAFSFISLFPGLAPSSSPTTPSPSSTPYSSPLEMPADNHRKALLQLFMAILCSGGLLFLSAAVAYEGTICSPLAITVLLWVLSALLVLLLSFRLAEVTVPLFLCCCVLDLGLSVGTLIDTNPRDLYLWFVCIPILMLYARGVSSCMVALGFIIIQNTVLRYVAEVLKPFAITPSFRDTKLGIPISSFFCFRS